jgi:hypothetical protein
MINLPDSEKETTHIRTCGPAEELHKDIIFKMKYFFSTKTQGKNIVCPYKN